MFLYLLNIFCLFILFRLLCLGWPFVGWKSVVLPYCGACSLWVGLCSILCNSMNCSMPGKHSLSFTIPLSLLKLMSIESGMPSNHPIFCCPLLLSSVFPSIRVFSNKSTFHIKCQSIGASASEPVLPMNIQGWFPLRVTGLIFLQSKGLLRVSSTPQFESISFWCSAFFMVQLSHTYMTTGKTITLTIWTFASKVISLLFNALSRFVITFLPRSKCLLIPWLQSPSAVILEPRKIKSDTVSTFSPSICHEVM